MDPGAQRGPHIIFTLDNTDNERCSVQGNQNPNKAKQCQRLKAVCESVHGAGQCQLISQAPGQFEYVPKHT